MEQRASNKWRPAVGLSTPFIRLVVRWAESARLSHTHAYEPWSSRRWCNAGDEMQNSSQSRTIMEMANRDHRGKPVPSIYPFAVVNRTMRVSVRTPKTNHNPICIFHQLQANWLEHYDDSLATMILWELGNELYIILSGEKIWVPTWMGVTWTEPLAHWALMWKDVFVLFKARFECIVHVTITVVTCSVTNLIDLEWNESNWLTQAFHHRNRQPRTYVLCERTVWNCARL